MTSLAIAILAMGSSCSWVDGGHLAWHGCEVNSVSDGWDYTGLMLYHYAPNCPIYLSENYYVVPIQFSAEVADEEAPFEYSEAVLWIQPNLLYNVVGYDYQTFECYFGEYCYVIMTASYYAATSPYRCTIGSGQYTCDKAAFYVESDAGYPHQQAQMTLYYSGGTANRVPKAESGL